MAPGSLDFISWFDQFLSNQMYISISDHSFFNFYSLTDSGFRSNPMNWSDLGMAQWKLFLKLSNLLQGTNRSLILIYIWLETNWLKEIKSRLPGAINLKRRLILKTGRTFHMILHCMVYNIVYNIDSIYSINIQYIVNILHIVFNIYSI